MSLLKRLKDRLVDETPPTIRSVDRSAALAAEEYVHQAWACRERNDLDGALANFDKAALLNPSDPNSYYGRGVIHSIGGNYKKAIADLNMAIDLYPNFAPALTERGLVYASAGNFSQALVDFDEAIAIDPAYFMAHQNKGTVYARRSMWHHALTCYDLALRLNPHGWGNYINHGVACMNLGKYQRATGDFITYLQNCPQGEYAALAQTKLEWLKEKGQHETTEWSVEREMWGEFIILSLHNTVDDLLRSVHGAKAYYVVLSLSQGQYALNSVYSKYGLRYRLTEIADVIGRDILELKLEQFLDQWSPCIPVEPTATKEQATQISAQNGGCAIVLKSDKIIGVLETRHDYSYTDLPTILFGKEYAFQREERSNDCKEFRQCRRCKDVFAYYKPVLENDKLADYACPRCGESPILEWVEARMRPGGWSEVGFLGEKESLENAVAQDTQTLKRCGVTCEQIADALDRLLETATAAFEDQINDWIDRFTSAPIPQMNRAEDSLDPALGPEKIEHDKSKDTQPFSPLDEIEYGIKQGDLPPEEAGCHIGDFQVFLLAYMGYQFCPWTVYRRPWSSVMPSSPVRIEQREDRVNIVHVPGLALQCQGGIPYRYADHDFLILNRKTGQYLRGPGIIVHLIRDHSFFEGVQVPYRVDPEHAARVLELL